ncbi:hypothetical protein GA845_27885 [Burkholderia pseudomallei]|nr:hypothetical protein [Burkholderia pseudomallei]
MSKMHEKHEGMDTGRLRRILGGRIVQTTNSTPFGLEEIRKSGIAFGLFGANGIEGVGPQAAAVLAQLADSLHQRDLQYRYGADVGEFRKAVGRILLNAFRGRDFLTLNARDMATVHPEIEAWFARQSSRRTHIVPCNILPVAATSVKVGPVTLISAREYFESKPEPHEFDRFYWEQFAKMMNERHASWLAVVEVDRAEPKRSRQLAEFATDLALAGLQLVLPRADSQQMCRLTGRSGPVWHADLHLEGEQFGGGITNNQPGRTLLADTFNLLVSEGSEMLESVGHRIDAFLRCESMCEADQAWCDAAYWFHDALAEPLDSIAMAKYETALEILFHATSKSGSEKRIKEAFHAFFGLRDSDALSGTNVTVHGFVKNLVEYRSKVLHGTQSTLSHYSVADRQEVAVLVFQFLRLYSLCLDAYKLVEPAPSLTVRDFMEWLRTASNAEESPDSEPSVI